MLRIMRSNSFVCGLWFPLFGCSRLMRDGFLCLWFIVYGLWFRFAAVCLSPDVTPTQEESTLDQRIGVINDQSDAVTPTQEESRFAQSHGVVSASNDEIASAKDLV